jgi:glucan-binding YG repeat protein
MKKKKYTLGFTMLIIILLMTPLPSFAHDLYYWSQYYTVNRAAAEGSADHFAINPGYHINGQTVNYYWANKSTENNFSAALTGGIQMWKNKIKSLQAIKRTKVENANVTIQYKPNLQPEGIAAVVNRYGGDSNYHIRQGQYKLSGVMRTDAVMTIYSDAKNYSDASKNSLLAHELGHLWAIKDLYDKSKFLDSIYSNSYSFNKATRHDINAFAIGVNNMWYETASKTLKRHKSPGVFYKNEWFKTSTGTWYYFKSNGEIATGVQIINGEKYTFESPIKNKSYGGALVNGAKQVNGFWYYYHGDGTKHTGWHTEPDGSKYFYNDKGQLLQNTAQKIGNYWYYFHVNGSMVTGWLTLPTGNYYYGTDGKLIQNTARKIGDSWYYFRSNGEMVTGWLALSGGTEYFGQQLKYYYGQDGKLTQNKALKIGDYWYYFRSNGEMVTGWLALSGGTAYLGQQLKYYYNKEGQLLQNTALKIGDNWYYFHSNGEMVIGWLTLSTGKFYYSLEGKLAQDTEVNINSYWYYFLSNGKMITGWHSNSKGTYYYNSSGQRIMNQTIVNGIKYQFNSANGILTHYWKDGQGWIATNVPIVY